MPTLNWIGKEAVVNHHHTVPFHLLKDVPDLSVGDPGNGNLIVQGDNLIALKALLPYYAGQVKCIYIDPPYNTGNEGWVYNDNVNSPIIRNWLTKTVGGEGEDLSRHDKWLCMMYPRLSLLRQLLREDGAIFVSIDDSEVAHLRLLMDDVFGRQNFIAEMIWEGAFKNDARQVGVNHEYVLLYSRNRDALPREWVTAKEGAEPVLKEVARLQKIHGDDYEAASEALAGWFRASKATPSFAHRRFRYIDKRGAYKEDDPTAPGGRHFELRNPLNNKVIPLRPNRGWAFDQGTFNRLVTEGRISFVTETTIMVRRYFHETDKVTPQSVFYQPTRSASERLGKMLDAKAFEFPKDELIIQRFVEMATDEDSLILDSFAGSGTTGHAVLAQNAQDGGNRRFILVEMESNIAREITRERVKRVARGYTNAKGESVEGLGGGFRFCELGGPLFDEHGQIRESVRFADLARHVYFTETGEPLPRERVPNSPRITIFVPLAKADEDRVLSCVKTEEARRQVSAAVELVRQIEKAFGAGEPRTATPYEQQLEFFVPLLSVSEQGRLFEFEKTHLIDHPWKLSDRDASLPASYDPTKRPGARAGVLDIGANGKVADRVVKESDGEDFIGRLQQQVMAFSRPEEWSLEELIAWLDSKIEHHDIPPGESAEFLRKAVRGLMARNGLQDVAPLVLDRFRLRDQIEALIENHRQAENRAAFQRWLLPESALAVSPEFGVDFSRSLYEPSWLYTGSFAFKKHYYGPKPGELVERKADHALTEEFQCAQYLDDLDEVVYWVRNLPRKLSSFRLQTSKDFFYPDFICRLKDGRTLVVEYKGAHLYGTADAEEKRAVGAVWEKRSQGKCLFVMPHDQGLDEIKLKIEG